MAFLDVSGRVGLRALASYVPPREIPNAELIASYGLKVTDSWIRGRIGVETRRWADPEVAASDLALEAARAALEAAGWKAATLDRVIVSTTSGDWIMPSTACALAAGLGAGEAPAYDVSAACSGFLYALDAGCRAAMTGDTRVLVAATEVRSRQADPKAGRVLPIYGDGAGAALLAPAAGDGGIRAIVLYADGSGTWNAQIPAGGSRKPMTEEALAAGGHYLVLNDGREIFERGQAAMVRAANEAVERAGWDWASVDCFIPHQANLHLVRAIRDALGVPEAKTPEYVKDYGNCSSATLPVAIARAYREGRIGPGARVVLTAAGGGYTAGAAALVIDDETVFA